MKRIIIYIILICLIIVFFDGTKNNKVEMDKEGEENIEKEVEEKQEEQEKTPIIKATKYIEGFVILNNQPMYYIYPQNEEIPQLVIYSHGQFRRITKDDDCEFMKDLKEYGHFFAKQGYAFSASNEHDDNWGNPQALNDIQNSINWFYDHLEIQKKINLIGFSMGGLSSINFAKHNSEKTDSVVLLAPTPNMDLNIYDFENLKDISIKLFHGDSDINIPIANSKNYVNLFKRFNKEIEFKKSKSLDHFDLEFFEFKSF